MMTSPLKKQPGTFIWLLVGLMLTACKTILPTRAAPEQPPTPLPHRTATTQLTATVPAQLSIADSPLLVEAVEPTFTAQSLHFAGWSPEGEWIALWMADERWLSDRSPSLGPLTLYNVETGERCEHPAFEAAEESALPLGWSGGAVLVELDGVTYRGEPCAETFTITDEPLTVEYAYPAWEWLKDPVSPGGIYRADTTGTQTESRWLDVETVFTELASGEEVLGSDLTEREHEVLKLLAHGLTNRGDCRRAGRQRETVKTHVGNILTKLQMAHRLQAAVSALKQGIISLDEIDLQKGDDA